VGTMVILKNRAVRIPPGPGTSDGEGMGDESVAKSPGVEADDFAPRIGLPVAAEKDAHGIARRTSGARPVERQHIKVGASGVRGRRYGGVAAMITGATLDWRTSAHGCSSLQDCLYMENDREIPAGAGKEGRWGSP